jgi:energy-coupling factor transporter transmembrane protein EcfT
MLAIVFGLVDYLGKLGVKGIWQLISSMLSGLILGGIVMYFTIYPDTAVGWFSVALFGLLIGLAASGCYQGIKTASAKGAGEKIDLDERLPK